LFHFPVSLIYEPPEPLAPSDAGDIKARDVPRYPGQDRIVMHRRNIMIFHYFYYDDAMNGRAPAHRVGSVI
jgi:hypothetical protein